MEVGEEGEGMELGTVVVGEVGQDAGERGQLPVTHLAGLGSGRSLVVVGEHDLGGLEEGDEGRSSTGRGG